MSDIPIYESRQERYGRTEKKTLSLTAEAIETIQAYADQHGLYFSVAIESLAAMGLGHTTAETLPRMVSNLLERIMNRQFNRFAKLISLAVISAEEANYKIDILLLQTLWREARLDPENFLQNMEVSVDPDDEPDALVRQIREGLMADAHEAAEARLRKPWNKQEVSDE